MNDAELLVRAAAGDADAFASFYRRHLASVVGFCLRATGSREAAADLAAEVFAAALEACDRYEPTYAEATPWLYGIARNKLRDSRRRGRVEDATRRRLGFEPVALEDEDLLRVDELAAAGMSALALVDELPAEQGRAIKAHVIEGREYAELASALGCSESVVRQRVSRGLGRLRTRLSKEGQR